MASIDRHDRDQDEITAQFEQAVLDGRACADCARWLDEDERGICRAPDCRGKSRWKMILEPRWEDGVSLVLAPLIGEIMGRNKASHERYNSDRAEEGRCVLQLMEILTGVDDEESAVADTITQLMHYCRMAGIDFEGSIETARINFDAELEEDCDWPGDEARQIRRNRRRQPPHRSPNTACTTTGRHIGGNSAISSMPC